MSSSTSTPQPHPVHEHPHPHPPPIPLPAPSFLTLPHKPNSPISYTFIPSSPSSSPNKNQNHHNLILFLNGLGLPASSWTHSIQILLSKRGHKRGHENEGDKNRGYPAILTYDRFAQGLTTSRDPLDGTPGREKGHGFFDVVKDLEELLIVVVKKHMTGAMGQDGEGEGGEGGEVKLLIIGASIGVPILRLYSMSISQPYPIAGSLFLDSNIANTSYSTIIPDPETPEFKFNPRKYLGDDCTLEEYVEGRDIFVKMFDFDIPNKEGLDRSECPEMLPESMGPRLVGVNGEGVELTVVGHDGHTFVEGSWEKVGVHRRIGWIVDDFWKQYNKDLTSLTTPDKCRGPIIAKGCGHFIQEHDPEFVAREILGLMVRLGW